jgi:hypothetical protein
MADGNLLWTKFDVVFVGFANDGRAEIVVRLQTVETDFGADLGGKVLQVALQFQVGQVAGSDLQARDNEDGDAGKAEEYFESVHLCVTARRSPIVSRHGFGRATAKFAADSYSATLLIQRKLEFGGKLVGVERATGKEVIANLKRGDFAAAVIDAQDEIFGAGVVFNVDFADFDAAVLEKILGTAAVRAPGGGVHGDGL